MVVDDVEEHAQSDRVRAVDERSKIVWRSIQPRRRIQVDAVIAPAEPAGEVGNRHHLDGGDAQVAKGLQLIRGGHPRSLRGERADVHLVEHLTVRGQTGPPIVGPLECRGIHNGRWTVRTLGLKPGHRIGPQFAAFEAEPVTRARPDVGHFAFERPVTHPREVVARSAVDHELECAARRCPDADVCDIRGAQLDAAGKTAFRR